MQRLSQERTAAIQRAEECERRAHTAEEAAARASQDEKTAVRDLEKALTDARATAATRVRRVRFLFMWCVALDGRGVHVT